VWFALLASVVALVGWRAYERLAMPDVQPHVGDGRFENHSWRFPWKSVGLPVPGYTIRFEQFDLANPFEATYRIEKLPKLKPHVGVYVCVADPDRKWEDYAARKRLKTTIELDVTDGQGATVCHVRRPIGEMIWSDPEGGPNTYGLYDLDESFFVPSDGERYQIRIRYIPEPGLAGFKGFVFIRCGGSI
jgi:hypothetical protein